MDDADLVGGETEPQGIAGIGFHERTDGSGADIQIVSIVVGEDFIRGQPLLREINRTPLGQPFALHTLPVAVGGEQRLNFTRSGEILIEDFADNPVGVFKQIASVYKGLIVGGGIRDVKIIAAGAVVFGVDAVERIGDLCIDVGADCALRPGRVDFTGGDILDVLQKRNCDIGGAPVIRRTEVDRDGLGNIGEVRHWHLPLRRGRFRSEPLCSHRERRESARRAGPT